MEKKRTHNLILFASGTGSNVRAIIEYFKGRSDVQVSLVVSNNPSAGVLQIAREEGVPTKLCTGKELESDVLIEELKSYQPSLLVLAGFLKKIPEKMVNTFPHQIINIHPALLPKYGGKGMYGMHVHEAVIAAAESVSGITIHYVNEHYDEGQTIVQATCTVEPNMSPSELAQKIHKLEHFYFPRTIDFLLNHK